MSWTEKLTVIQALESQCQSWLAARKRFKDIPQSEQQIKFMNHSTSAVDAAVAKWQERAQEKTPDQRGDTSADLKETQEKLKIAQELKVEMHEKFKQIIDLREAD